MIRGLALLALLASSAAAHTTPPLSLCDAGVPVELRLYELDDGAWSEIATGAASVVDLGTGEYYVEGLPDAAGDAVYQLWLTSSLDPAVARASYTWSAKPTARLVWRAQIERPAPLVFKVGDALGTIELRVLAGLPFEVGEAGSSATFDLYAPATGELVLDGAAAAITDITLDVPSGTYGASLLYDLAPGDLTVAGDLLGEFTLCVAGGECMTLPADDTLEVTVLPRLGG